jgi:uncharacterized protein (DUF362 family)
MKRSNERKAFDDAIDTILKADPAKVKAEMEADKRQREEERKAKKDASKPT